MNMPRISHSGHEHAEVLRIVEEEAEYGNPVYRDDFPTSVEQRTLDECVRNGWLDQHGDEFYLTEKGHAEAATHGR